MNSNLSDLTNLEKANQEYIIGLEFLQTSCIKCRFNPNYLDAIPHLKKAAEIYRGCGKYEKELTTRDKLVKCFNSTQSYWEEGNEYEKISKTQLNQLKSPADAQNSIINSFHAYATNRNYDEGIKAISKSSNEFVDSGNKECAIKILEFAFEGINKYYHVLTLNNEDSHLYIYECIDKYIDLLFDGDNYEKASEIALKSAELIENEKKDEKRMICKYYGFQAIAELLQQKDNNFQVAIEKGMNYEDTDDDFCTKINRLVNVVKQNDKENERIIKNIYNEIARRVPTSLGKKLNTNFIAKNPIATDNSTNNDKTNDSEEEDLK